MGTLYNMYSLQNLKMITNTLKLGSHFFISYKEEDEIEVIQSVYKYNNTVLLLKSDDCELFQNNQTYVLDYYEIDLDRLFSSDASSAYIYVSEKKQKPYSFLAHYLYFFWVPDGQIDKDNQKTLAYSTNVGKIMLDHLKKYLYFEKEIIVNNRLFMKFSQKRSNKRKPTDVVLLFGGIGDFFINYSVIYEYIKEKNKTVYVANKDKYNNFINSTFLEMVQLCFKEVKILELRDYNDYFWLYFVYEIERINKIFDLDSQSCEHMAMYYKNYLLGDKKFDFYKHNSVLQAEINERLKKEERSYIKSLLSDFSKNVGLQYFTGFLLDEESNYWDIRRDRKWNPQNVLGFVKVCRDHGINLIVLNSDSYDKSLAELGIRSISIPAYAYLISQLDFVVGVDSSAGHIASFFGVPSMTLWGSGSAVSFDGRTQLGYRVLRKNISIVPKTAISDIDYQKVFSLLEKALLGIIEFKEDIITYKDSQNDYLTFYI